MGKIGGSGLTGLALTLIITAGSGGTLTGGAGAAVALTAEEVVALGLALAGNVSAVKEVWDSSVALAEANSSSGGDKKNDEKDYSGKSYDGSRNPDSDFTNSKGKDTLSRHLNDHGADFGYTTEKQYLDGARNFLEKSPTSTTQSFISPEGTYFRYDTLTNEFGIINEFGGISTYFKPETGIKYWLEQISKYALR